MPFALAALLCTLVAPAAAAAERDGEATNRARGPDPSPLQALIDAAAPGAVIEVPPGHYEGRLLIRQPLSLRGRGAPILDGRGHGDVLVISAPDVTVEGFVIQGSGADLDGENVGVRVLAPRVRLLNNELRDVLFGIDLKEAPDSVLRGNLIGGKDLDVARRGDGIRLWRADRTVLEDNVVRDGRDAILWYSTGVQVRRNVAERCRYGFHLMYSNDVVLEDNLLRRNSVGVYFMYSSGMVLRHNVIVGNRGPSGYGIGLKDTNAYLLDSNLIAGNRTGIYLDNSPSERTGDSRIWRNTISGNDVGAAFLPSVRGNVIYENAFLDNMEQVAVLGRGELAHNSFERDGRGNAWSDYIGYDRDGDGVGEEPHAASTLFEHMTDREPKLRFWLFSPAQDAVEFIARAVPAVQPEPKFEDPSPLVGPVDAWSPPPTQTDRWPLAAVTSRPGMPPRSA